MSKRNERMEKLNGAGVDTRKYFNIDIPNGLRPGAKIQVIIDEDGYPKVVTGSDRESEASSNDYIASQIIADGYVRNTKLHRRFVMAQMFHMLNYVSYDGRESGFNACLKNRYGYHYTLNMMLEEVRVLSKLEARDVESFEERKHFFTKQVIVSVLEDYVDKLKEYVYKLPDRKCKGVPYKRVHGQNIFNDDLYKKLYSPIKAKIAQIRYAHNYSEVYIYMKSLMTNIIRLPFDTPKSKAWIDAYKGEGAYYTLKNLIMFHDCVIEYNRETLTQRESIDEIYRKLDEYQGEGWRMFALMKKVIEDNDFDFNNRMEEIYSEQ
jgi:hypothetical protein